MLALLLLQQIILIKFLTNYFNCFLVQELYRQGEVLRNTEKRVDKMQQDLKESDRHLRSIKSLWGAFMNKFSKEPTPTKPISFEESTEKKLPSK